MSTNYTLTTDQENKIKNDLILKINQSNLTDGEKLYVINIIQKNSIEDIAKIISEANTKILNFVKTILEGVAKNYPSSTFADCYNKIVKYQNQYSQQILTQNIYKSFINL